MAAGECGELRQRNAELEQVLEQRMLDLDGAEEDLEEARTENARLKQWVDDLQSGMWVNCVYCGHRYGPGETTPVSMADALKEHIEQCPEHPLFQAKQRLAKIAGHAGKLRAYRFECEAGPLECCVDFIALAELANGEVARDMKLGFPTIVCLCGSTRFWREFQRQSLAETLAGKIVLSIGAASGTDDEHFGNLPRDEYERVKAMLDEFHLRKIDLADEVLILNVGGYIGDSTRRELEYALGRRKCVRFLEPPDLEG